MLKRMTLIVAAAVCSLTLGFHGPAAHAAGTPNVLAKAQADNDPGVLVWVDTDKGTGLSDSTQAIHDQFAGSEWAILDNGVMTVSKAGKVLVAAAWASNKAGTYVPIHSRIGTMTVDGTIFRQSDDMSKGFAELFINQVASDGKSARSLRIEVSLAFAGQQAPADNGGNNDGGFGGF
jgi:hypothetical protein